MVDIKDEVSLVDFAKQTTRRTAQAEPNLRLLFEATTASHEGKLPLALALQHDASDEVAQLLGTAAPEAVGADGRTALRLDFFLSVARLRLGFGPSKG